MKKTATTVRSVEDYCRISEGYSALHAALCDFYRDRGYKVEKRPNGRTVDRAHELAGQMVESWQHSMFSPTEGLRFVCEHGIDAPDSRVTEWQRATGQVRP